MAQPPTARSMSTDGPHAALSELLKRETRRLSTELGAPEEATRRELENAAYGYLERATVREFVPLLAARRAST